MLARIGNRQQEFLATTGNIEIYLGKLTLRASWKNDCVSLHFAVGFARRSRYEARTRVAIWPTEIRIIGSAAYSS